MPPAIKNIGVKFMKQPEHVKIKAKEMTADLIDQYYVRSKDFEKFDIMTRLLDVQNPRIDHCLLVGQNAVLMNLPAG